MYKVIGADGREYGPVTTEQLRQWMAEGRANAQTRVQLIGTNDWKIVADFPELLGSAAGAPPPVSPVMTSAPAIPNYLVGAILTTLCCCLPLGIPAIVFAAQVNSKIAAGDIPGAQASSRKARMWVLIAIIAGVIANVISGIIWSFANVAHRQHF